MVDAVGTIDGSEVVLCEVLDSEFDVDDWLDDALDDVEGSLDVADEDVEADVGLDVSDAATATAVKPTAPAPANTAPTPITAAPWRARPLIVFFTSTAKTPLAVCPITAPVPVLILEILYPEYAHRINCQSIPATRFAQEHQKYEKNPPPPSILDKRINGGGGPCLPETMRPYASPSPASLRLTQPRPPKRATPARTISTRPPSA